jgi:hypothetical protein
MAGFGVFATFHGGQSPAAHHEIATVAPPRRRLRDGASGGMIARLKK